MFASLNSLQPGAQQLKRQHQECFIPAGKELGLRLLHLFHRMEMSQWVVDNDVLIIDLQTTTMTLNEGF